jgi:two-component system LytT family response regulator
MILNCVIIDDEPLAAQLLESYAEKIPYLNLIGTFNSATKSIKTIRENEIDLIFLDIQMPDISGIEFAKILPASTKIIFTTAFSEYALEGFRANAIDYLMKPISYENFCASVRKVSEWFSGNREEITCRQNRFMFIKSDYKLHKLAYDNILYIEGLKDYIKFYLADGKTIMSLINMRKLEETLPVSEFMRVHRSYIVNLNKIDLIDRFRLVINNEFIPVSESYKDKVQTYLDTHTIA